MNIILYTIGCPMCKVLKEKLDSSGVVYEINESEEEMRSLNIDKLPVLSVDGQLLSFTDALKWITEKRGNVNEEQ